MRRAAKADENQPEIVAAYRKAGASVLHLHRVGEGCPDVLIGFRGVNYLIEIKDHGKIPSKRRLTKDEAEFAKGWNGQVAKVETVPEALAVIGVELCRTHASTNFPT